MRGSGVLFGTVRAAGLAVAALLALPLGAAPGGAARAADPATVRSPGPELPDLPAYLPSRIVTDFLTEGFEAASFPPTDWLRTGNAGITGSNRWHRTIDSTTVFAGTAAARVLWQAAGNQNERLFTPGVDLSGESGTVELEFWWYGNPFWASNADFQVDASSDSSSWANVWAMSGVAASGFQWRRANVDLSSYAGGDLFLRLRYIGIDGADVAVDEFRIGNAGPPPLPGNDTCAGAEADSAYIVTQAGPFSLAGDNTQASSDYPLSLPSCTGFSHTGRDLVWVFDVPVDHEIDATMTTTGSWDDTLFLVTDCANPGGTCVDGDNALPDGSHVAYTNPGPGVQRVYLIASGYSQGAGAFQVDGFLRPAVSVDAASWGRIKAGYR